MMHRDRSPGAASAAQAFALQPLRRFPARARLPSACPSLPPGDRVGRSGADGPSQASALRAFGPSSLPAARRIVPRSTWPSSSDGFIVGSLAKDSIVTVTPAVVLG